MGNLWIATRDNGWVRADQIAHVTSKRYKHSTWPTQFDVIVRTTLTAGSWRQDETGWGSVDPIEYSLHRCASQDEAGALAKRVLWALIAYSDRKAVLEIEDGELTIYPIDERSPGTKEPDKN